MKRLAWLGLLLALAGVGAVAQESYPARPEVRAFVAHMAERHGFNERDLLGVFAGVRRQGSVLRAMARPAEAPKRSWQAYRAQFLTPARIEAGVQFRQTHEAALSRAAEQFGVPAEIIVAIIGVETVYGRNTGGFRVIDALATLAFDFPPRAAFFRDELEQYLLYARESGTDVFSMRGSYAGAIGIPQFMPGSYRRFAVDFDGDGQRDLHGSPSDAVGSVANFLKEHGWRRGEPIGSPARVVGEGFREMLAAGIRPVYPVADLTYYGVLAEDSLPRDRLATLVDLETPGARTEYWVGLQNFYAITRYNRSAFYTVSVIELARAIARASGRELP